jgi:hypothetical protein
VHSYATVCKQLEQCRRERKAAIRLLHRYERAVDAIVEATDNSEMSNVMKALDLMRQLQSER